MKRIVCDVNINGSYVREKCRLACNNCESSPSSMPSGLPSSVPSGLPSSVPSTLPSSVPTSVRLQCFNSKFSPDLVSLHLYFFYFDRNPQHSAKTTPPTHLNGTKKTGIVLG